MSYIPKMPTKQAGNFLVNRATATGIPSTITMMVTDRCNYSCSHCYQEHGEEEELTTEEIFDYLQQFADVGVLFITFMGGEFFMRRDADEILARAHELGFAIKVLSTGHHITEKRADFLASIRPLHVDLSLYGSKPEIHEAVTRHEGSWERTYQAAKRLIARNITVLLKTPVMESNVHDLRSLEELAHEIGAQYTMDPKLTAVENGDTSPLAHRMSQASLENFYENTMGDFVAKQFAKAPEGEKRPLDHTPCFAGQVSCFINPQGKVWPCASLAVPVGDLRKESFREIWQQSPSLNEIRNLRWATISECNECPVREHCNRCHGMAMVEHGNMKGPSLESCRHAVATRDALRNRGLLPADHTALPPTWDRVEANGQHDLLNSTSGAKRSSALRILP